MKCFLWIPDDLLRRERLPQEKRLGNPPTGSAKEAEPVPGGRFS